MKFKIAKKDLAGILDQASMALPARSSDNILLGFLIEIDESGVMTVTGSDNELRIEKKTKLSDYEAGNAVLPGRLFSDIVRSMPDEEITVDSSDSNFTSISTSKSSFQIASLDPDEYPEGGQYVEDQKIKISRDRFIEMVNKTAFAASREEARGVITGVLMDINGSSMNMVALDGFRIAVAELELESSPDESTSFIISARVLNEILKLISSSDFDEEEIEIGFNRNRNNAEIMAENTKITMSLINGTYLNYKNLLPEEYATKVDIDKEILRKGIERAILMSDDRRNNLVKLTFADNTLTVSSRSETGNFRDTIPVSIEGSDIEIGFNAKYFLDGLKAIDTEKVILKLSTNVRPCTMEPENGGYIYMVLPVRIL